MNTLGHFLAGSGWKLLSLNCLALFLIISEKHCQARSYLAHIKFQLVGGEEGEVPEEERLSSNAVQTFSCFIFLHSVGQSRGT